MMAFVAMATMRPINRCSWSSPVLLLLAVAVTACGRRHHIRKGTGLLIGESEDDIRDNVFNYDEQGGGEEDEVERERPDRCSSSNPPG